MLCEAEGTLNLSIKELLAVKETAEMVISIILKIHESRRPDFQPERSTFNKTTL
jgi:hypothetical protein